MSKVGTSINLEPKTSLWGKDVTGIGPSGHLNEK